LPAHCCQPAVAGGIIYADLWGELSTHLAPQALFTQSSPVREPLLQAFPFPSTLGEVTLPLLSQACVFIYSSCGRWVFPPLLWSFPPSATLTSFPAPHCWARALSGQARLVYLQFREGFPSPPCLYCCYCLLLSFSFFPRWMSVCPGAMLLWPRVVGGSTAYHLAHLVRVFPSHLGAGVWWWPGAEIPKLLVLDPSTSCKNSVLCCFSWSLWFIANLCTLSSTPTSVLVPLKDHGFGASHTYILVLACIGHVSVQAHLTSLCFFSF
jgi:hypothetical protein